MTIKVFLVDDHEIVRRGLRELLSFEHDLEVVGEAGTVEQTLQRIQTVAPDVAILDVQLPDGTGVEACREIRSMMPEVACVMLTSFPDDEALLEAVMAGAAGYALKNVRDVDIIEMVRRAAAGESLLDAAVVARLQRRLHDTASGDERLRTLTEQEGRILRLIAEGKTNRQIADELYLAEKTIKNYVTNVLSKMGLRRRTEAAVYMARLEERESRWGR